MVTKKGLPEWGELVVCTVTRITPYAAWCNLKEYPGMEGMIHVSEVAGKWVHDIRNFVKQDKEYVAKVVKIDYQKNFINLSLKRVTKLDKKERMNFLRREKRGEGMLGQAAKLLGKSLEQAYEEVGFLLQEKFEDIFTAFERVKESPDLLAEEGVPKEWVDAIAKVAGKSFVEREVTLKAELDMKSFAGDGVEKIKEVLNDLENNNLIVKYISAPKYRIELKTKDPKKDEKKMTEALEQAIKKIKTMEGEGEYKLIK